MSTARVNQPKPLIAIILVFMSCSGITLAQQSSVPVRSRDCSMDWLKFELNRERGYVGTDDTEYFEP